MPDIMTILQCILDLIKAWGGAHQNLQKIKFKRHKVLHDFKSRSVVILLYMPEGLVATCRIQAETEWEN